MAIDVKTTYSSNTIEAGKLGAYAAGGTEGSPGVRNDTSLKACFAGSPLVGYSESEIEAPGEKDKLNYAKPENVKAWYIANVVKGTIDDASYGLGGYDLDFGNNAIDGAPSPPDLVKQAVEAKNVSDKPANGFVPNPTSPGEGSLDSSTKPEAPKAFADKLSPNGAAFSGDNIVARANLKDQAKAVVDRLQPPA